MSDDAGHCYFAYGSNMNPARLEARIGAPRRALSGRLDGWRLCFDKRSSVAGVSHANVQPEAGAVVEGVLYELLTFRQLLEMDPYEGHPQEYERRLMTIETPEGQRAGWVYIARPDRIDGRGRPAKEYLAHLLAGRRYLSDDYYRRLAEQPCIEALDRETLLALGVDRDTPG